MGSQRQFKPTVKCAPTILHFTGYEGNFYFFGCVQRSLKFPLCLGDISHLLCSGVIIVKAATQHESNYSITHLSLTQSERRGHIIKVKIAGDKQAETSFFFFLCACPKMEMSYFPTASSRFFMFSSSNLHYFPCIYHFLIIPLNTTLTPDLNRVNKFLFPLQ